jgi:hypothetical protein
MDEGHGCPSLNFSEDIEDWRLVYWSNGVKNVAHGCF